MFGVRVAVVACAWIAVAAALGVTPIEDSTAPYENSKSFVVLSGSQGFIVDTMKYDAQADRIVAAWKGAVAAANLPSTLAPSFIFITHGHPDHWGGLGRILASYPNVPVYVADRGVVVETVAWNNTLCPKGYMTGIACATDYARIMTPVTPAALTAMNSVLSGDDSANGGGGALRVVTNFARAETAYAGMLAFESNTQALLFSGDIVSIASHLWVSDFIYENTLPYSDYALCQWAGDLQDLQCSLPSNVVIYSGHGPDSATYQAATGRDWSSALDQNIEWLAKFRSLSFNSCNATHVWDSMIAAYPTFGMTSYIALGALSNHFPADASSAGCACVCGANTAQCTPTVCNAATPLSPPSCPFLASPRAAQSPSCALKAAAAASSSCPSTSDLTHWWAVLIAVIAGLFGGAGVMYCVSRRRASSSVNGRDFHTMP